MAMSPTATTGRFIRKTQPHQACESSQPPRIGPAGKPSIVTVIKIPTARERSSSRNRKGAAARAIGRIAAAPIPSSTRDTMNHPALPETAHASDPTPNTRRATRRIRLRPHRSPSIPAGIIAAANASV